MLSYAAMRQAMWVLVTVLCGSVCVSAESSAMRDRQQLAATEFHDGILLLHAKSQLDITADGFRQDPYVYAFTGLQNTIGALFAIDGKSGECWLFLPSKPPLIKLGLQPEVAPGPEAVKNLGIEHVVDWSELEGFFARQASRFARLYYVRDAVAYAELPPILVSQKAPDAPTWLQEVLQKWPALEVNEVSDRVNALMAIQSTEEMLAVRSAARATVKAIIAGLRAIRPNVSQRNVEAAVVNACWTAGAHGSSFWPWAMAGENAVFPRPFISNLRYDHLNRIMRSGDLVRLDVGCEWDHYQGDLGRTVPVSGRYDDSQRETWNIFVAAYHAGVGAPHDGVTVDQVFEAWQKELLKHRASATTLLAQHAIDSWSNRKDVPFWQVHTTNLLAAFPVGPLRAGTTINFEPIASVDGQGFFLEDMFVISKDGAELLTPGVPYSAEDIEAAMN